MNFFVAIFYSVFARRTAYNTGVLVLLCMLGACGGNSGWESDDSASSSSSSSSNSTSTSTSSSSSSGALATNCSRAQLSTELTESLQAMETDTDFAFYVESESGEHFEFSPGEVTLDSALESASTSKWVTAAVILDLVDQEVLTLADHPQDHLDETEWAIPDTDPLYNINLAQLLNFTSGLTQSAGCVSNGAADFFTCVQTISENNIDNGKTPGTEFFYGPSHLQVAGAMAVRAAEKASWEQVFTDFKADTGLFTNSSYNLPSTTNPRLAGGMTWTGNDYIGFIREFSRASFYNSADQVNNASADRLDNANIGYSPALTELQEQWHYGFGMWIECHDSAFNCSEVTQVSSPGTYGAYPFWNKQHNYFGIIARQGGASTFPQGYAIFNEVRYKVENWATCPNE